MTDKEGGEIIVSPHLVPITISCVEFVYLGALNAPHACLCVCVCVSACVCVCVCVTVSLNYALQSGSGFWSVRYSFCAQRPLFSSRQLLY